jgi:hypothetical protein
MAGGEKSYLDKYHNVIYHVKKKMFCWEKLHDPKGIPLYSGRAAEDPKRNGPAAGVVFSRRAKLWTGMEESSGGGGAPNALFLQFKMQKEKKDQKLLGFSSVPAGETKSMSGLGIQTRSALLVYYRNPLPRQAGFNLG